MKSLAIFVLCAATAFGQSASQTSTGDNSPNVNGAKGNVTLHSKAKPAPPASTPPAAKPADAPKPVPTADVVVPKESVDSLKLQLAMEKEKSIQEQAQSLQQQAMQAIEPRMVPLRADYQAQLKAATEEEDKVRKENGWGPDIVLDQSIGSSTYGMWIKKKESEKKP